MFICNITVNAQDDNFVVDTATLSLLGGGIIDFKFNSISKYQSSIEYIDWTVINVNYTDDNGDGNGWGLYFKAADNALYGGGTNTLPLNVIKLSTDGGSNYDKTLTDASWVTLASGSTTGDHTINISYKCEESVDGSFLGDTADYYTVNILFGTTKF